MTTDEELGFRSGGENNKGPLLIGLTIMFEVIAIIFLGLRLYSRYLLKQNLKSHDYLNFIGFVSNSLCIKPWLSSQRANSRDSHQGFSVALATCAILIVQKGGFGQTPEALFRSRWKQIDFGKVSFHAVPSLQS